MKIAQWIIGVLFVIVVALVAVGNIGSWLFDRKITFEVGEMYAGVNLEANSGIITIEDLKELPEPVQKWLQNSQVIGKERIVTARIKQEGFFRTKQDKNWMPFTAEQYYTTDVPSFVWYTTMRQAPLISITGRDRYYEGRGNMLIKLMSVITVVDASGPEMDQGTLVRYLNEIMWFPTAALSSYIEWEPLDSKSALAWISYGGVEASAIFYFNEDYDLVNFIAQRYADLGGDFHLEEWATPITGYQEFNGIRVANQGEGVWKLESGDFTYIKVKVVDIEYNNPSLY